MRRSASEERGLDLEHLDPPEAIERLIDFTWNYFLRNPEFLALLNTENLAKARHLKRSTKVKSMHSPFVEMIRTVVTRGVESGDFRVAVDPVQLYISIAALCFFYLSNSATLSRDLRPRPPEEGGEGRAPRPHGGAGAGGVDRKIDRGFRQGQAAGRARAGASAGVAVQDPQPGWSEAQSGNSTGAVPGFRFAPSGLQAALSPAEMTTNCRTQTRLPVFIQRVNFVSEKTIEPGSETWPSQRAREACRKR